MSEMYSINTAAQTFGVGNVSPSLHSLNQKHNKNSNIVKYYYIITFLLHLKWLFSHLVYFKM